MWFSAGTGVGGKNSCQVFGVIGNEQMVFLCTVGSTSVTRSSVVLKRLMASGYQQSLSREMFPFLSHVCCRACL